MNHLEVSFLGCSGTNIPQMSGDQTNNSTQSLADTPCNEIQQDQCERIH
jgi:hypothetical protein